MAMTVQGVGSMVEHHSSGSVAKGPIVHELTTLEGNDASS